MLMLKRAFILLPLLMLMSACGSGSDGSNTQDTNTFEVQLIDVEVEDSQFDNPLTVSGAPLEGATLYQKK